MIMDIQHKEKLLHEFGTMKLLEQDAYDFYLKISQDPNVKDEKIRNSFSKIAEDEQHHTELVDQIINIVTNSL